MRKTYITPCTARLQYECQSLLGGSMQIGNGASGATYARDDEAEALTNGKIWSGGDEGSIWE